MQKIEIKDLKNLSWKSWFMLVTLLLAAGLGGGTVNVMMNVQGEVAMIKDSLQHEINSTFYGLQSPYNYVVSVVKSGATTYYTLQNGTDGTLQWYSTNKTALHVAATGNLTDGGTIYCKNQTWTSTLTLLNTVMVIESYNGTWRTYSNQGKIMVSQLAADPNTTGWGQTEQGFEWYNTVEDTRKYWNGTGIVIMPSIGGGSSSSYTLPYSYTIYKSGSNYVMEKYDGTTWSSTNASSVFNNAAGNLTSGRSWIEWIKVQGNFTLTSPVLVSGYTGFDLRGSRLWSGANIADGAMFESASFGTARSDWTYFLGGWLDGVKATYTGGSGIRGDFRHSRFEGMTITAFPEYGVCIEGYSGINADADQFVNDWIGVTASNTGNKLGGLFFKNSGGTSNDHQITNCFLINNGAFQAAIQGASGTTKFSNVHFAGNPPASENPSVSLWLNGSTSRVQVENCHFEYSDYESILVNNTSYAEQLIFTGNTFTQSNQDATANNTRSTIFLDSTSGGIKNVIIAENTFASSLSNKAQYAINIRAGTENVDVHDNSIRTTTYPAYFTAPIINSGGSTNKFLNNMGFVTENWVSGANTTATTIVISHNLAGTPQYVFASFNFTGWTSWTWTATSTQITITVTGTLPASYTAYAYTKYDP